jgi:tRNA(Glu) U13 pseudouridine synthase TruD
MIEYDQKTAINPVLIHRIEASLVLPGEAALNPGQEDNVLTEDTITKMVVARAVNRWEEQINRDKVDVVYRIWGALNWPGEKRSLGVQADILTQDDIERRIIEEVGEALEEKLALNQPENPQDS